MEVFHVVLRSMSADIGVDIATQQTSVQEEKGETMRLIDADAIADILCNLATEKWNKETGTSWANAYEEVMNMIEEQPTIDADPVKHGQWYDVPNYLGTSKTMYFCSICGSASWREDPYCWYCGSKMDVPDTDVGKTEDGKND